VKKREVSKSTSPSPGKGDVGFYNFYFFLLYLVISVRLVDHPYKSLFFLTQDSVIFKTGHEFISVFLDEQIDKVLYINFFLLFKKYKILKIGYLFLVFIFVLFII
jgi:hypothetical protein